MPVSPAREIAYQILRRVESGRAFAVDLLQQPQVSALREVDRNLATELVMGALRWHGELDFQIERLSGKPLKYFDPEIATILAPVLKTLGRDTLQELNAKIAVEGQDAATVAQDYLESQGFLER